MNRVVEYFFDENEEELVPFYRRLLIVYGIGIIIILFTVFV